MVNISCRCDAGSGRQLASNRQSSQQQYSIPMISLQLAGEQDSRSNRIALFKLKIQQSKLRLQRSGKAAKTRSLQELMQQMIQPIMWSKDSTQRLTDSHDMFDHGQGQDKGLLFDAVCM